MAWLAGGFCHRKSHVILQQLGSPPNYIVMIKVYKGAGVDGTEVVDLWTAGKVYCGGICRDDFGDIRFTDDDETTELDYWMHEDYTVAGVSQVFWVRLNDNVAVGNVTIYMYYDNPTATTTSNIANTFIIGDSFDGVAEPPEGWGENIIDAGSWQDITASSIYKIYNFSSEGVWHGNEITKAYGGTQQFETCFRLRTYNAFATQVFAPCMWYVGGVLQYDLGFQDAWGAGLGRFRSKITGTVNASPIIFQGYQNVRYTLRQDGTRVKTWWENAALGNKVENQNIDEIRLRSVAAASAGGFNPQVEWYWIYIRPFNDPEPAHGVWGAEDVFCACYDNQIDCEAAGCNWCCVGGVWVCQSAACPTCPDYDNQDDCEDCGCCWYEGECYDCEEVPCGYWDNQIDCEAAGCNWCFIDDVWQCVADPCPEPLECSDYDNQIDCEANGCCWCDGVCRDCPCPTPPPPPPPPPPPCSSYLTQVSCEGNGCYWCLIDDVWQCISELCPIIPCVQWSHRVCESRIRRRRPKRHGFHPRHH